MSEMDWETTSQPFPPQLSTEQLQCPYRPSGEAADNYNFPNPQSAVVNSNVSFNPGQAPPQGFWNNFTPQDLPAHAGVNNRFPPAHANSRPPRRVSDDFRLDYHMRLLEGQADHSTQARSGRFEANRPVMQRNRPYLSGSHASPDSQTSPAVGSSPSAPSGPVNPASTYYGGMAGRNGSASTGPHESSPPQLITSPSRHLPPPNSSYHGLFPQQNMPYHRPARFSADVATPNGPQSSTPSMPPHSPPIPREAGWGRTEQGPLNAANRNWFHETFYSTQMADLDSDDDSIETQEEHLRRQGRLDPAATLQFLHDSMRLSSGPRRPNPAFDAESHEISVERDRAARRAAAAAVKFVASPSALAALENVDLTSLKGDDQNCIICYNEFGVKNPDGFIERPVRLPRCKHIFGDRCLKQWLQDSDSCPYCRDKLPSEPKRSQPGDEARRISLQSRPYGIEPWIASDAVINQTDPVATAAEREQHYQHLIQQRLGRRDDGPDDILARIRRRDEYEWGTSFNQTAMGLPSRSMPDYDGRRRYRGRHSTNRTAVQGASRTNGHNTTRSSRSTTLQAGPMRTPLQSSAPSFDENTSSQRRSVTPHPTMNGHSTWSSPPQLPSATSARPSSLPTERSPLREASDVRHNNLSPRTPSANNGVPTTSLERPWSDSQNSASHGWMMSTSNGRPASATFINEMPQVRLQQLQDDLDSINNHIQNNRLPPYMGNSNEAAFNLQSGSYVRR